MRSLGCFALHSSASMGLADRVRELILDGYPLNLRDTAGRSALYCCVEAYRNCFEKQEKPILSCIEVLLDAGADLMVENKLGHTPLDGAVQHGIPFNENAELCYSPYGMDMHKSSKKMGELIKLLARKTRNNNFSWLTDYAMLDQPIDECLTELFGILEMIPKHLIDTILLRSLMGGREFQHFILAAVKHGVKIKLNLHAMREPFRFVNSLRQLNKSIPIETIKRSSNFIRTPIWRVSENLAEYFEDICKQDKSMSSQLIQIFELLRKVRGDKHSVYLRLLLRLRKVESVTLKDLKPECLKYVQKYYIKWHCCPPDSEMPFQHALIQVYLFVIVWIEHRPEDFGIGEELRDLIETKFDANCSLHFLINFSNSKTYDLYLASFIELGHELRMLDLDPRQTILKLIEYLFNQALNRRSEDFDTVCDGGTVLHFAAASGNIDLLTYLVCEKDLYLFAIDNRYQTFLDIMHAILGNVWDEEPRAEIKKFIKIITPLMLLRPLKTLCAGTILNNPPIFQSMKSQLKDHHPLVKFINLHKCPDNRRPVGGHEGCQQPPPLPCYSHSL